MTILQFEEAENYVNLDMAFSKWVWCEDSEEEIAGFKLFLVKRALQRVGL